MAIAQRKTVQTPAPAGDVGPRAKPLRPFERGRRALRAETHEALVAFERAAQLFGPTHRRDANADRALRLAAARTMDELRVEAHAGSLPEELASEVERWDEGQFQNTWADVELANFAIVALLGSDVRVDEPPADLEADVEL